MSNSYSKIVGVGSYVPPRVVTNFDIEEMMDTSDEWIQQRTGIVERRWVDDGVCTTDLALEATNRALENAGMSKDEIDMIVFSTLSSDYDFPGGGCFLQAKMDLPGITALDIRQQCTGFLYGISVADKFIKSGSHKNILVVASEVQSRALDKTPKGRDISVLFGDGAGAVIMTTADVKDPATDPHLIGTHLHADGSYAKELWMAAPGSACGNEGRITHAMLDEGLHFPHMNGKVVFVHAVKRMCETLTAIAKETNISLNDIDCFFFHQANLRINSKVAETLGIPDEKVFNTIQSYGNTTSATIPLCMDDAMKAGVLKPGMLVGSAAFGSGFTWASAIWRQ